MSSRTPQFAGINRRSFTNHNPFFTTRSGIPREAESNLRHHGSVLYASHSLVTQSLSISTEYVVPEEVGEGAVTREATQERGEEGETLRREGGADGGDM